MALACHLFSEGVVSLAKAARLGGLSNEAFIERLGAMGVPAVDYDASEIDGEVDLLSN